MLARQTTLEGNPNAADWSAAVHAVMQDAVRSALEAIIRAELGELLGRRYSGPERRPGYHHARQRASALGARRMRQVNKGTPAGLPCGRQLPADPLGAEAVTSRNGCSGRAVLESTGPPRNRIKQLYKGGVGHPFDSPAKLS